MKQNAPKPGAEVGAQPKVFCIFGDERVYVSRAPSMYSAVIARQGLKGSYVPFKVAPEDLAMVKGGPQPRRQFLDLYLGQADPLYIHHLSRYHRALKQRNLCLRQRQKGTLEVWEQARHQISGVCIAGKIIHI